ncbi:MAG: hypothetical protein KME11_00745 [Timaviella obliquedivisa GSE-PSE-MK23-08B]|jgi:hypothetical protein|nr:hypothetical protein [Timaviella obliquedivisa GSE-PSE-MK23-08B]
MMKWVRFFWNVLVQIIRRKGRPIADISKRSFSLTALVTATLLILSACLSSPHSAQFSSGSSALAALPTSVGTNLNGIADWSTQQPFIDAFKSSRSWITQCQTGEPGCKGNWSTDEFGKLNLDQSGWVKSLPAPADPAEYTRVSTLLFRDLAGQYPSGKYLVLYAGEGTIEYGFDARKDESTSKRGRDVLLVTPSDAGILLTITATDPRKTGNYIRNIQVIPEQYEQTYRTQIFNPVFLERVKKFKTFRFMDWMQTNGSEQGNWDTRAKVTDATYATGKGVPLEVMLDLANRMGVDPWFTMPHKASDLYMTNFAKLVRDRLNENRKVYVEYSNEVWNWQFPQAQFALQEGKSRWSVEGDVFAQWYGFRTAQMSDIWKQVFGRQRSRVVSVMGTQTAWRGLENAALDCPLWVAEGNKPCYQHGIDVLAIAGYFGGSLGQGASQATVEAWSNEGEVGFKKAIAQLNQGSLLPSEGYDDSIKGLTDSFRYYQNVARSRGLQLVAYEGGQHLVNSNNPKLSEFFISLNRRPEMTDLYTQLLEAWKQAGGTVFMNFSDIARPGKWGSWGALEYVGQERSPKYNALIQFIDRNS